MGSAGSAGSWGLLCSVCRNKGSESSSCSLPQRSVYAWSGSKAPRFVLQDCHVRTAISDFVDGGLVVSRLISRNADHAWLVSACRSRSHLALYTMRARIKSGAARSSRAGRVGNARNPGNSWHECGHSHSQARPLSVSLLIFAYIDVVLLVE